MCFVHKAVTGYECDLLYMDWNAHALWGCVCMAGGCAWHGGVHGRGCAWQVACVVGGVHGRRDGHCSRRYASYWNELLLIYSIFPTARIVRGM